MATSLMQTAHNLINMLWLSRLGEDYVAAAGMASQFIWLSMAFTMMCRIGSEIGVSQNMGRGEPETAKKYAQNGFMLALGLGVLYCAFAIIFRSRLISFFDLDNPRVVELAERYLLVIAFSVPFSLGHFVVTGVFSGFGNTKLPFYVNAGALALNIVLSPILIFGLNLGFIGAGIAMVTAQAFNLSLKIWALTKYKNRPFEKYKPFVKISKDKILQILRWGIPVAGESFIFTFLFMIVSRVIAQFGSGAVAAHNVALQIESLSFMVGGGFASALTAFVGQNYGARKWGRLRSTTRTASIFMLGYGIFVTAFLALLARPLVNIFLDEPYSIDIGVSYLRVIAFTQILFCLESVAMGSFRGRGQTGKPAIASISANVFRVIIVHLLASTFFGIDLNLGLGVTGVWIGIAAAMTLRSVWVLTWHYFSTRKQPRVDEVVLNTDKEVAKA